MELQIWAGHPNVTSDTVNGKPEHTYTAPSGRRYVIANHFGGNAWTVYAGSNLDMVAAADSPDKAVTAAANVDAEARAASGDPHVTTIEGPDSVGHWSYRCTRPGCDADESGHDRAADVIVAATSHGPLAANSTIPTDAD